MKKTSAEHEADVERDWGLDPRNRLDFQERGVNTPVLSTGDYPVEAVRAEVRRRRMAHWR